MYMCLDCKSHNVIDTSEFLVYFREGDWIRQRTVTVYKNLNLPPYGFISFCPALSITVTATGDTKLDSILNLAKVLKGIYDIEMVSKNMAFYNE